MSTQNGNTQFDLHHSFDEKFDAVKAGVKKMIDRATTKPTGEPSRLSWFISKTGDTIKAHPIVAVGVAIGFGYLVVRFARR